MFTHHGQLSTRVFTNNTYSNPRNPTEEAGTNYFTTGWKSVLFQVREVLCLHMSEILKNTETKRIKKQTNTLYTLYNGIFK